VPGLIILYLAAGALEALGIFLAGLEFRDARNRLQSYKMAPQVVDVRTIQTTVTMPPATIRVDPPPPLETRVQVLENTIQQQREQHAEGVTQLKNYARKEAAEAIDYMQNSVDRELTRLVDPVFALNDPDRPGWRRWWLGPTMLASGLVLGVIGNVLSALWAT
jgi:hypothetical protein